MIAKLADSSGFDLLAMGSHGHANLVNLVMGSVATQVLAAARCRCCWCAEVLRG